MTKQRILLGVDIPSFINVMRRTFDAPHVHIRELIQNSLEATFQAVRFGAEPGPIRIDTDDDSKTVSVRDEGIGMTREELATNLTYVFSSGWPTTPGETLGIGQFGFGFFSVFLVADEVIVISRSRRTPDLAHRWHLSLNDPDPAVTVDDVTDPLPAPGTSVRIRLRDAESFGTDTDFIAGQLTDHYLYMLFPIQINSIPASIPTVKGWSDRAALTPVDPETYSWLGERWKWRSAPLYVEPSGIGNGGWVAIAPKYETVPGVDVYRKGIRVVEQELIPYPLNFFICGLVDLDNINLKPDRETVLKDEYYRRLTVALERRTKQLLLELVEKRPFTAKRIFAAHRHALVLAMLQHDDLRLRLGLALPVPLFFPDSERDDGEITLEECIQASENRTLYWTDRRGADDLFADRIRHLGRRPVYLEDADLRKLVEKLCKENEVAYVHLATAYLTEMQDRAVVKPELREIFLSVVDSTWDVLCAEDIDARLPVKVVSLAGVSTGKQGFRRRSEKRPAKKTIVVVNVRNQLIADFAGAVGVVDGPSLRKFAHIMIGLAKISGDSDGRAHDFQAVNKEVLTLLHSLMLPGTDPG